MKEKKQKITVTILALAGLLVFCLYALAGNLEPNAPPGPTMKTLDQIYEAINSSAAGTTEREGYCRYLVAAPYTTDTLFTVDPGQRFTLLKFYGRVPDCDHLGKWSLTVDDNTIIPGGSVHFSIELGPNTSQTRHWFDFPDRCVVVRAGQILKVVNSSNQNVPFVLIGYFYDAP